MMQENIKDTWAEHVATYLPHALLLGFLGWGVAPAIGHLPTPFQSQQSATISVTKSMMRIDGKDIPIITSRFTPNGTFTIGKPFHDETLGAMAYPFLSTSWRSMPNSNPLKPKIKRLEETTGEPQNVAYSIHAGSESLGCIVLPKRLGEIASSLEGRQIEIKTGEG